MIITVGNEKGGTGKTTITLELALAAMAKGYSVKLVDVDHQQSATLWSSYRADRHPTLPQIDVIPVVGKTVGTHIQAFAKDHDLVLVDVGGKDTAELRLSVLVSNVLLVPTTPSVHDVWPLETVSSAVHELRLQNPALQCWILPARIKHYRKATAPDRLRQTVDAEEDYRTAFTKVLNSAVCERAAFDRAAEAGLSVRELKGSQYDAEANYEIKQLVEEIFQ